MQGLSCQRVSVASAPGASHQKSTALIMDDDFFPPLLSRANSCRNQPPVKPYKYVSCLTTYIIDNNVTRDMCF